MTDPANNTYTWADRHLYTPPPCDTCGSTNVDVHWIRTPVLSTVEDTYIPGNLDCLNPQCPTNAGL